MESNKTDPVKLSVHDIVEVKDNDEVRLISLYPYFLQQAKQFRSNGEPAVGVVFAQTAAELLSEQVLVRLVVREYWAAAGLVDTTLR